LSAPGQGQVLDTLVAEGLQNLVRLALSWNRFGYPIYTPTCGASPAFDPAKAEVTC